MHSTAVLQKFVSGHQSKGLLRGDDLSTLYVLFLTLSRDTARMQLDFFPCKSRAMYEMQSRSERGGPVYKR